MNEVKAHESLRTTVLDVGAGSINFTFLELQSGRGLKF